MGRPGGGRRRLQPNTCGSVVLRGGAKEDVRRMRVSECRPPTVSAHSLPSIDAAQTVAEAEFGRRC